jgi:hypothetical protein
MTPKLLLRIAAILMLIHLIGHSIGHSGWKKDTDPGKAEVVRVMTGAHFPFMGVSRSMGDYYEGYGYVTSAALLLMVLVLWFSSSGTGGDNRSIGQIVLTVGIVLIAICGLEFAFFFPFAAGISLLAGLFTLAARLRFPKTT